MHDRARRKHAAATTSANEIAAALVRVQRQLRALDAETVEVEFRRGGELRERERGGGGGGVVVVDRAGVFSPFLIFFPSLVLYSALSSPLLFSYSLLFSLVSSPLVPSLLLSFPLSSPLIARPY